MGGAESVQEAIDEAADLASSKHEGISLSGFGFDDLTATGSYKIAAQYRHHPDADDELGGRARREVRSPMFAG
ncbi:MAG: hypothetical protein HN849_33460 [Victivallales bacterium]|nr:hypothetical protein [Victivallales bacterium]MBT7162840.1 hypothetical protein [Victivallales bacterium]MBT7304489.1 hypothetical protein [Victivallales bacterium]